MNHRKWYLVLSLILAVLGLISAIFPFIQDIDPALYAEIAREIASSNNFFHIVKLGQPYHDKPPLFFWEIAIFFKIFGINHFVYKFVILLNILGTAWITTKIYELFENKKSILPFLLYISTFFVFLVTMEPKIDPALTFFMTLGIYFALKKSWIHVVIFSPLFLGLAVATKGPVGFVLPCGTMFIFWLLRRDYFNDSPLKRPVNIILFFFVLILSSFPAFYVLYLDQGVGAIKYILFEQSFFRFFNKNFPKKHGPFYFLHTILWAYLPWTFLFLGYLVELLKRKARNLKDLEIFSLTWFLLGLFGMSLVRWKMPQYVLWILPPTILLITEYFERGKPSLITLLGQGFIIISFFLIVFLFWLKVDKFQGIWLISIALITIVALLNLIFRYRDKTVLVSATVYTLLIFELWFSGVAFPFVTSYNPFIEWGRAFKRLKHAKVYFLSVPDTYVFSFYSGKIPKKIHSVPELRSLLKNKNVYIIADSRLLSYLNNLNYLELDKKSWFRTSKPTLKFLNKNTRPKTLKQLSLITGLADRF